MLAQSSRRSLLVFLPALLLPKSRQTLAPTSRQQSQFFPFLLKLSKLLYFSFLRRSDFTNGSVGEDVLGEPGIINEVEAVQDHSVNSLSLEFPQILELPGQYLDVANALLEAYDPSLFSFSENQCGQNAMSEAAASFSLPSDVHVSDEVTNAMMMALAKYEFFILFVLVYFIHTDCRLFSYCS